MLWVDKYRPKKLSDLSFHDEITNRLKLLAENPATLPHLFVHGPSGGGKKTRIMAFLRQLYGPGALKLKLDKRVFTPSTGSKTPIEVQMITSNYHIEICPGDAGLHDRFVIQEIIKEMASNRAITSSASLTTSSSSSKPATASAQFKIVILSEVDRLSKQAQAALRRTMEKYAQTCRLILVSQSAAKVMEPVRSRCLAIRVASPTDKQICQVLKSTVSQQRLDIPEERLVNIARESNRNLRRALLMLEASHVAGTRSNNTDNADLVVKTDWELYIAQLAADMMREQSPQRLLLVREKIYELLVNCIPPTVIMTTLVKELLPKLDMSLQPEVLEWAAFYQHRLCLGSKEIFHIEAFVAKFMALYKTYLNDLF